MANTAMRIRAAPPLDPDRLIARARQRTGLFDLGSPPVDEGLAQLCTSLEREACLTPVGRWIAEQQIVGAIVNRLEVVACVADEPAIEQQVTPAPIVIAGLPRTGTTLLHRLLARDPQLRGPRYWELMRPCPPPYAVDADNDRRPKDAARAIQIAERAAPQIPRVHEFIADEPDECVMLMNNDFASLGYLIQYWVPSYLAWLESIDLTENYFSHRRQLQVLQWEAPPARWVLKAPAHLMALPALLSAYPDACIVQTHRDPLEVVPSTLSLLRGAHGIVSDGLDQIAVSALVLDHLAAWIQEFAESRAAPRSVNRDFRYIDVEYEDLREEPMAVVVRLYDSFGLELSELACSRMKSYLRQHPQHERGRHDYTLEEFGLDERSVRRVFDSRSSRT